ncbi:hypothetical protein [Haloferula rosea]|uniref:Uncharacterized protein n=1 Tax=Haloferula rosea TaxID=490093 RepID=A0A934R9J2_9BACT|nr:hypothetical protein [Haloferula rosea]MBK1826493.1 hypothetical protein [Haloferula rosea]
MKTISRWVAVLLCFGSLASAQEGEKKVGFIRLIHALAPGEGKLSLLLNGVDVYPSGYQLGNATGGIGVDAGRCKVVIRRDGVTEGTTTVDVEVGETTTVIPFAERIPATDDEPAHWQIRILRLKQTKKQEGRVATFVSVSAQPELAVEMREPEGGWTKQFVKRFGTANLPMNYPEGYVPLRVGDQKLSPIPVMDEGTYVVVLFDDEEGKVSSISFRDFMHLTAE